jgi:hypothetical protein
MKLRPVITATLLIGLPAIVAQAGDQDERGATRVIEFRVPGAATVVAAQCGSLCGTQALANNNEGTAIGFYTDENVVPHGFLRTRDGRITSFDAPGAGLGPLLDQGTVPYSINDRGVIAGQYADPGNVFHAFIRHRDGSFESLEAPDAGTTAFTGTLAYSINFEGDTAGVYVAGDGSQHGFVRRHGEVTEFDPAGSVFTMVCEETCLNQEGTTTGFYFDSSGAHGFVRSRDGALTTFDAPGAVLGTVAASITDEGEIAGYVVDANGVAHGFIRHRDGSFSSNFDVPQAFTGTNAGTAPFSINASGTTAGAYSDANLANHGFSRSRDGHFTLFDAPGAGAAVNQGTRPSTNNREGEVAGWWVDAGGLNHAFVWGRDCRDDDEDHCHR